MLVLLLLSVGIEWLLYALPFMWGWRTYIAGLLSVLVSFSSVGFAAQEWNLFFVFVLLVAGFRVLNLLRIVEGRMHERYLLGAARRSGLIFGALQILALYLAILVHPSRTALLTTLTWMQLLVATGVFIITLRNIFKSSARTVLTGFTDKELPTVTVAIPARNETAELEACLRSVLANTYPKLEVLVLDDCSQDKTADVIRSFAQDGVRFVKGDEPSERWLAKNQAYDKLADEANGELILFCGVDVRLGPETIRALVTTLLNRKKDMISVLPRRLGNDLMAAFIQPMRYWWELALPRRYVNRPPVLSTCWLIRRKKLEQLGGFEAVRHTIIPEGYFAREFVKRDRYSFLRADDVLDVQTRKSLANQRSTAVRMRYPQIRRRPEMAFVLTLVNVLFLLGPFVVLASGIRVGFGMSQSLAAVAGLLLVLTHVAIMQVSNPANTLVAVVNLPFAILTDIILSYTSMLKYEFTNVDWRGRNICIPVMHVTPRLPKLKD